MEIKKRIEQHLDKLCREIGPRPTGSKANLAAADYVCKEFERAGLSVVKQEFDCMDWTESGGTLNIGGQPIHTVPAPYSLPCSVTGELLCVHSLEELRTAGCRRYLPSASHRNALYQLLKTVISKSHAL